MNKIKIVISREYISRVRKKSFIIMTFLTPILFALIIIVPMYFVKNQKVETKKIAIVDKSEQFSQVFVSNSKFNFTIIQDTSIRNNEIAKDYYALVEIPKDYKKQTIKIYSTENISLETNEYIKATLTSQARNLFLISHNIDPQILQQSNLELNVESFKISTDTSEIESSSSEISAILGYIGAFIIYMFIFIYGSQLMRSAMDEKKDRIVEVLVSSVKPFQLLMGKIIGVALVAFTQFLLWVLLIIALLSVFGQNVMQNNTKDLMMVLSILKSGETLRLLILFLIYFIGGYLLYGSLFAAIGGAVDSETDTQQFMLPITLPMILAIVFAQTIISEPNGDIAKVLSQIPFTSPIVMLVRLNFGVPIWEIALSISLLILTFLLSVYIAAKIYRVGILSYGKKITYSDLWKWIKTKD